MREVHVESLRTIFDSYFRIDEAMLRYQLPDGRMSALVRRLSFERGDSAAAVVVDVGRGAIILTRQFRFPAMANGPGWVLELVAGSVEKGETPEACIRREIVEELGYEVEEIRPVSVFYTSPGGSSERVHLFHITVSSSSKVGPGGGNVAEGEDIELETMPLADVPALLASGQVIDAKTLIGLCWLTNGTAMGADCDWQ